MKTITSILLILFTNFFFAQSVSLKETTEDFSTGKQNAFKVNVPYCTADYIAKKLKGELKDWHGKYKESKGEHTVKMGKLKDLGDKPFDVYAKVIEKDDKDCYISLSIDLGGAYLNSKDHPEKYKVIKSEITKMAIKISKDQINKDISREKDALKDLEKQKKSLIKEEDKLSKQIKDYEKQIEQNKKRIEEIKNLKQTKSSEIKKQEEVLKSVEKRKN